MAALRCDQVRQRPFLRSAFLRSIGLTEAEFADAVAKRVRAWRRVGDVRGGICACVRVRDGQEASACACVRECVRGCVRACVQTVQDISKVKHSSTLVVAQMQLLAQVPGCNGCPIRAGL